MANKLPQVLIDRVSLELTWFGDFLRFCFLSELNTSGAYPNGTTLNESFEPAAGADVLRVLRDASLLCFLIQSRYKDRSIEEVLDAVPGHFQDLLRVMGHREAGFLAEEALSVEWQDYALPRARKLRAKKTTRFNDVYVPTSK